MPPSDDERLRARLHDLFLDELEEQVGRLESGLEAFTAAGSEVPQEAVAELFRSAHSLKGAAQEVGAARVASACHELEELLAKVRDGGLAPDTALLDRLRSLVDTVAAAEVSRGSGRAPGPATPAGPVPGTRCEPAASGTPPAAAAPVTAGLTQDFGSIRVASHKVDLLMAQAGDLITATYGSEAILDRLASAGDRLLGGNAAWSRDRAEILDALTHPEDRRRVTAVLERIDERTQTLVRELDEVLRLVTRHQRSVRVQAASFADATRSARVVPFEHATSGLSRTLRDLARELGKQAELVVSATDVEVDKELVIRLREILGHLVRNALDHGLEPAAERLRAGKPATGVVRVQAGLRSTGIEVVVSDDGRGVDERAVRAAAVRRDVRGHDGAELEALEAVFAPGLSTADAVSAVSGRGVGLDAVRALVESTGGTITLASEPGAGTTVTMLLPLNLSTMRALLVRAGDQLVAVPSAAVRRLIPLAADTRRLDGRSVITLDDEVLPVAGLDTLLGWGDDGDDVHPHLTGVVVAGDSGAAVLATEQVVEEREIVLRASPGRVAGVRIVLGTTQLDDGSVVLVLNPAVSVRTALFETVSGTRHVPSRTSDVRRVLLVEDSLTTRELERSLLEAAGFAVTVANDGEQAWHLLKNIGVDAIVSDVNMPRMDGIALCRAVRASTRLRDLPVVLVTSLHSDEDRQAGLDAGADAYLTKNDFNRDDLVDALERLL